MFCLVPYIHESTFYYTVGIASQPVVSEVMIKSQPPVAFEAGKPLQLWK